MWYTIWEADVHPDDLVNVWYRPDFTPDPNNTTITPVGEIFIDPLDFEDLHSRGENIWQIKRTGKYRWYAPKIG